MEQAIEKNYKTILFGVLCFLFGAICFLSGCLLDSKLDSIYFGYRYIRLKEHKLGNSAYVQPNDEHLSYADGLMKKSVLLRVDDNGFIQPSKRHSDPDISIIFLGGSTTECLFVEEENRFPYLSAVLLEKKTKAKINSYNSGASGNNSLHSVDILLNKGIPLKLDIAVMMHVINDLTILLYEGSYWNNSPTRSPIITKNVGIINKILNIVRGIDEFAHIRGTKLVIRKEYIKKEFEKMIETFVVICKVHGITPVLMTQFNRLTYPPDELISRTVANKLYKDFGIDYKEYQETYSMLNDTIREIAKKHQVLLIDLDKEVPKTRDYIYDPVHLNANGSIFVANIISEKLEPLILEIMEAKKAKKEEKYD